jgi:GDP/UDP-N,N'-diacetylbacillosamine 2-epimerase (hydrolysing)
MKKICVVTGTRAEYGLLRWLIDGIRQSAVLELQLIATGTHLSPEYGMTGEAIRADGFRVDKEIEILLSSDTTVGVTKSMGLAMIGFADVLADLRPDLLLVLGDRYEIFAAAAAATIARVPIAHLHGGEVTAGVVDEPLRHSITKMAHLHFVATEEYRSRVIQLGEHPTNVFSVGGLGIDNILRLKLLKLYELEAALNFKFAKRNFLITFHPLTLEHHTSAEQLEELLAALDSVDDAGLIFTMPNADTDGRALFRQIQAFCARRSRASAFRSLGQLRYLSCIQYVDGVLGNSSSGLTEVPSFKKGTINIGDRQRGRQRAPSVIDCLPERAAIVNAIEKLVSPAFQKRLSEVKNPYGTGGASNRIVQILEQQSFENLLKKQFYDLPVC